MGKSTLFGCIGLMTGLIIGAILASIGYPPIGINGVILGVSTTGVGCIVGGILEKKGE